MALAGFGRIEIFASVNVVWRLTGAATPGRERRAPRLIGRAFAALVA